MWSVMIPAHRPNHYVLEAVRSVLVQAPSADRMQIEVLIDGAVAQEWIERVREVGGDRVGIFMHGETVGQARNLNTAISRARGEWVHILHHDDLVLPGFYEAIETGVHSAPEVGAAFTRHAFIDEDGHWQTISDLERRTAGVVDDWLRRMALYCRFQPPSIAVRRGVYERIGGFREDLVFAVDWEMWVRVARHYDFWYDPRILALYRVTDAGVTGSMRRSANDMRDVAKAIDIIGSYLPADIRATCRRAALEFHAHNALNMARTMYLRNDAEGAANQIRAAFAMSRSVATLATAAWVQCGRFRRAMCEAGRN